MGKILRNVQRTRVQSATVLHNILPNNFAARHLLLSDYCPSHREQCYLNPYKLSLLAISSQTTTQKTAPYHATRHSTCTVATHPYGRAFTPHCRAPYGWL